MSALSTKLVFAVNTGSLMNLADHFFQMSEGFVTFKELSNFCSKHGIQEKHDKLSLLNALKAIGAQEARVQWKGKEEEKALLYIALRDVDIWEDKQYYGKGVTIIDLGEKP
jgi:hypothetical protein